MLYRFTGKINRFKSCGNRKRRPLRFLVQTNGISRNEALSDAVEQRAVSRSLVSGVSSKDALGLLVSSPLEQQKEQQPAITQTNIRSKILGAIINLTFISSVLYYLVLKDNHILNILVYIYIYIGD